MMSHRPEDPGPCQCGEGARAARQCRPATTEVRLRGFTVLRRSAPTIGIERRQPPKLATCVAAPCSGHQTLDSANLRREHGTGTYPSALTRARRTSCRQCPRTSTAPAQWESP